MNKIMIEICAGSYSDCIEAYKGGADRVELNSALSVGGLTPSLSVLKRVKLETNLKVICMIRPREAGFFYNKDEIEIMLDDAKLFLENGADGISFGFLNEDRTIDEVSTKRMSELAHSYGKEAVFHRAFDITIHPIEAIEKLIECKIDRVLTSGQKKSAIEGMELIRVLQENYGDKIQILPGSGINSGNVKELLKRTKVSQIHSSCKCYVTDSTTGNDSVSFGVMHNNHINDYYAVDGNIVKKLINDV